MENNCELVPRETHLSFPNCLSAEGRRKMLEIFTRLYQQVCAITKIRLWVFFIFFIPSGWTRWWKRGELSFLPKALHGFVAERSEVHSDYSWHEEVSPPLPQAETLPHHLCSGTFTQNSIKRQSERENGLFTLLIQTLSHLSKGVLVAQVTK